MIRELNGEKIDIIEWSDNASEFVQAALSPAKVLSVELREDDEHLAIVSVVPDQLSLAIGKGGQNVRLAAKLTGWKITVVEQGGKVVADSETGTFEEIAPLSVEGDAEKKPETAAEADATDAARAGEPLEGAANAEAGKE
jgi:N utilization substance protein A